VFFCKEKKENLGLKGKKVPARNLTPETGREYSGDTAFLWVGRGGDMTRFGERSLKKERLPERRENNFCF